MFGGLIGAMRIDLGINSAAFKSAAEDAQRAFSRLQKGMASTARKLDVVGAGLSLGVTAPLVAFAKSAVQAAGESEQAIAAVNASLASMGDAAGFSSKQLQDMAEQLQGKSLFEDDEILTKVTANMLTFGNVQGDVFDRAQKSALDLSARLGTDLQGSAIMVGKALNNPIAGLSALTKVGVSFSAQQKDQVKSMMSVGDIAGAQAIILGELERQYKGQADAARNTPYGQIQAAMMDIGNAAETVGAIILPVLADIAKQVSEAAEAFQTLDPEMQTLIVGGAAAAAAIGPLLVGLGLTVGAIGALSGGLVTVLSGVGALAVALSGPLLTGLGLAATAIGAMAGGVVTCLAGIGSLAVALSGALVTGLVAALSGIGAVAVALSGALATGLVAALSGIGAVATALGGALLTGFTILISPIGLAVAGVAALAVGAIYLYQNWEAVSAKITGWAAQFGDWAMSFDVVRAAVEYVSAAFEAFKGFATDAIGLVTNLLTGDWSAAWQSMKDTGASAFEYFDTVLLGLPTAAMDAVAGLARAIKDGLATLASDMVQAGKDIVSGLIDGIKWKTPKANNAIIGLADEVKTTFRRETDMHSPSRVFAGFGDNIVQGLVVGIDRTAGDAVKAIDDLAVRMKDAGRAAADGMLDVLANGLANGNLGGAIKDALSGYMSDASSAASDIFKTAFTGGGLKSIVTSISGAFKGITGAFAVGGAGIAGALSAALPIVGIATSLVGLIKGFSSKTQTGGGLDLNVSGGKVGGEAYETFKKSNFWGLNTWNTTETKDISSKIKAGLNKQLGPVQDDVQDIYARAGVSVTDRMVNAFKFDFGKIATAGKTDQQIQAEIEAAFAKYQDGLSKAIKGVSLQAVAIFADISDALDVSGQRLQGTFKKMAAAAGEVADLFGGAANLQTALSGFVDTFFTDAQKLGLLSAEVKAAFADIGKPLPTTLEGFRDLVLAQNLMTETGRERYHELLEISDEFALMLSMQTAEMQAAFDAAAAANAQIATATTAGAQTAAEKIAAAFGRMDGWYQNEFDARLARVAQSQGYSTTADIVRSGGGDQLGGIAITNNSAVAMLTRMVKVLDSWDVRGMPTGGAI